MRIYLVLLAMLLSSMQALAMPEVILEGMFRDKAIVKIDGEQKVLKVGQETPQGIKLIAVNTKKATFKYKDKRFQLGMSQRIASSFSEVDKRIINIPIDRRGGYYTKGKVNDIGVFFLVDTGANVIALNSSDARRLGIDYKKGEIGQVRTASGVTTAYSVMLNKVDVGGIVVHHVKASVIEGNYPETALLGMTYLKNVQIQESNNIMQLSEK